jgi:hypothetical protein
MSTINSVNAAAYTLPLSTPSPAASPVVGETTPSQQDIVELSLAGRIALGVRAGRLTSDQGQELFSQLKTINQSINGGTADTGQLQSQLSQQIYADGHNGAAIPAGLTVSSAIERDFEQAGRIAAQESDGNLTKSQADEFFSQIRQLYQESQNGASPSAINQAQNQLSVEIYDAAHGITSGPSAS